VTAHTPTTLEPLAVYDVHEDNWLGLTEGQREELAAWLREHDVEPDDAYRLEIYLLDCPFARVFQFDVNERGKVYCRLDHDHVAMWESGREPPGGVCEIARRTFDVPLSSMPPVKPWSRS
jgi:hypothetical protein